MSVATSVAARIGLLALVVPTGSCVLHRAALPIDEAAECRPRPPAEPRDGDMHLVRLPDATARCNDGSPPAMYVREATSPEHANDWVIQVEGGGNCHRSSNCLERWCTRNALMSSARIPDTYAGDGILSRSRQNPFGDWNVVRLNYCSSDDWLGAGREAVVLDGLLRPVKVPFSGHLVLRQLLDALDAGVEAGPARLPKLTSAEHILWTGYSAGADGAAYHLDEVAERYGRARTVGLIDAYLQPDADVFPASDRAAARSFEAEWEGVHTGTWHRFGPAGCKTGKCQGHGYLWSEVLRTPAVLHQDLRDPRVSDLYTARGMAMSSFSVAAKKTLERIAEQRSNVSVIGSSCGNHITTPNEGLFELEVDARGGGAVSLLEAVERLMAGDDRVVAIDAVEGGASHCPTEKHTEDPSFERHQGGGGAERGGRR